MSEEETFSPSQLAEGQIVKGQIEQQAFFDFLENETELYALDYLGYPWYWAGKFSIVDSCMERGERVTSTEVQDTLARDFVAKVPMLSEQYDYAFIVKSKMRGFDSSKVENPLFVEIFDYLKERNKSFIIFEQEEKDARCDLKYLSSKYAANTISYNLMHGLLQPPLAETINYHTAHYLDQLAKLFCNRVSNLRFASRLERFEKGFHELSGLIGRVVVNQFLFEKMQIGALFGGMGSFVQAGLNNSYSIVEVGHSYFGRTLNVPPPHYPAMNYMKSHFKMEQCYHLALTADGVLHPGDDILNLEKNRFDFGMPALRTYPFSNQRVSEFRKKLDLEGKKVVLIATNGWVDYRRLESLVAELLAGDSDVRVLLRPHPSYENANQHTESSPAVKIVLNEDKNDLFSVADVVLTIPSSIAVEATPFTENIIVFPDLTTDNIFGRESLQARYPFAKIIPLTARKELVSTICDGFSNPRRRSNPKEGLKPAETALDELFARIENAAN